MIGKADHALDGLIRKISDQWKLNDSIQNEESEDKSMITLICKKESLNDDGTRLMNFTLGKKYMAFKVEDELYEVKDDYGKVELFWTLDIMFLTDKIA